MAKSDSTRNPPSKVWLVFDSESRLVDWANHRLGIAKSDEQAHQYAPVQKPRRCVWVENEDGQWATGCLGLFEFTEGGPEDNEQKFCGYCGGQLKAKHYDNSGGTWEECVHGRKR